MQYDTVTGGTKGTSHIECGSSDFIRKGWTQRLFNWDDYIDRIFDTPNQQWMLVHYMINSGSALDWLVSALISRIEPRYAIFWDHSLRKLASVHPSQECRNNTLYLKVTERGKTSQSQAVSEHSIWINSRTKRSPMAPKGLFADRDAPESGSKSVLTIARFTHLESAATVMKPRAVNRMKYCAPPTSPSCCGLWQFFGWHLATSDCDLPARGWRCIILLHFLFNSADIIDLHKRYP